MKLPSLEMRPTSDCIFVTSVGYNGRQDGAKDDWQVLFSDNKALLSHAALVLLWPKFGKSASWLEVRPRGNFQTSDT